MAVFLFQGITYITEVNCRDKVRGIIAISCCRLLASTSRALFFERKLFEPRHTFATTTRTTTT